jgi:tetratricopeptide (TPR) repeat protein
LTPADARIFRELAELQVASREFSAAIRNLEAAGELVPEEAQTWNELGYARAYAGNLDGAKQALQQYQQLLPQRSANALDSLGEVSFSLGDFSGAAKDFLDADQKNRSEFGGGDLVKAAQARLMAGDLGGADALFRKYTDLFQGNQRGRAAFLLTQWEFMTGRRKAAMAGIEKIAPSLDPDNRSQAWSQLSIWKMQTGDANAAADWANRASGVAQGPRARTLSAICRLISKPPAQASGSPLADALALLFARKFTEATPLLERAYRETNPSSDGQVRTLLAWAYVKTNRTKDAAGLLTRYPLPLNSGDPMFASLIFPRYLFLRATVFEGLGKRAEAKSAYELYLRYAGDVPEVFGDDAVARKKLNAL